ncbi:POK19 protein, partial [Chloroceryle aenea]|nr:POK19 protein [Chloroceryle aenea]
KWEWIVQPKRESIPITDALTAYTDAGRKSRTAAITWQEGNRWKHKILQATESDTLQTMELLAVVWAMLNLKGPSNVVMDSLYVASIVERIEDALIKEVQNQRLFELLV